MRYMKICNTSGQDLRFCNMSGVNIKHAISGKVPDSVFSELWYKKMSLLNIQGTTKRKVIVIKKEGARLCMLITVVRFWNLSHNACNKSIAAST